MVLSSVAHVGVGALLLANTAVLTIQVWRHTPLFETQEIPAGQAIPA
jgi:hypothetical protein